MASASTTRRRVRGRVMSPYRGSRKRLRQIVWSKETPPDFWVLIVVIVMLLAAIAWSMRHVPA
jgi:hypothetical protein